MNNKRNGFQENRTKFENLLKDVFGKQLYLGPGMIHDNTKYNIYIAETRKEKIISILLDKQVAMIIPERKGFFPGDYIYNEKGFFDIRIFVKRNKGSYKRVPDLDKKVEQFSNKYKKLSGKNVSMGNYL